MAKRPNILTVARRNAKAEGVTGYTTVMPFGTVETWYDRQNPKTGWITQLKDSEKNQIGEAIYSALRDGAEADHLSFYGLAAKTFAAVGPYFPPAVAKSVRTVTEQHFGLKLYLTRPEQAGAMEGKVQFMFNRHEMDANPSPNIKERELNKYLLGVYALWTEIEKGNVKVEVTQ